MLGRFVGRAGLDIVVQHELRGVGLQEAALTGADLASADLTEADLRDADLSGACRQSAWCRPHLMQLERRQPSRSALVTLAMRSGPLFWTLFTKLAREPPSAPA